jgi:hypothetical protein
MSPEQERLKRKWASVEALVGSEKRLALVAQDLVKHFEDRLAALDGKGMIVCMSRRICVAFYDAIVKLRPQWHSDDDDTGAIKVVMTGAASDPPAWQRHTIARDLCSGTSSFTMVSIEANFVTRSHRLMTRSDRPCTPNQLTIRDAFELGQLVRALLPDRRGPIQTQ